MQSNNPITTVQQAIDAIVTYNTLPPQIDYTLPWRLRADRGQEFINKLSDKEQAAANTIISQRIDDYYGENGAAQYDTMF